MSKTKNQDNKPENTPKPDNMGKDAAQINLEEEQSKPKNAKAKAAANAYAESQKIAEEAAASVDTEVISEAELEAEAKAQEATIQPEAQVETDYKNLALKTAAEFDNYRKRITREKAQWKREALADFLKDFLPAFDDLDRAITEGEKHDSYDVVHDGARLVRDNMKKSLQKAGVTEIEAEGKQFNPLYHEAMTMVPMPGAEPNSVIEVFQSGYMIDDFVLRPAKVVVAADLSAE